jgi:hypothetical protein
MADIGISQGLQMSGEEPCVAEAFEIMEPGREPHTPVPSSIAYEKLYINLMVQRGSGH